MTHGTHTYENATFRTIQVRESEVAEAGYIEGGYGDDGQQMRTDYNGYIEHVTGEPCDDAELIDSEGRFTDPLLTIAYGEVVA